MSELINNQDRRRDKLLQFSGGMIEGKPGKELIDEYREAIENVTPEDLLVIEDKQVRQGIKPAVIKKHIEKILNVLGPYLERYSWQKPSANHPLAYLMEENRRMEELLTRIKEPIKRIELGKELVDKGEQIKLLIELLEGLEEFNKHYLRKENILFPYLEKKWDYNNPLRVMWSLHDDIRGHWKLLISLLQQERGFNQEIRKGFGELFSLMYRMVFKEEKILFPVAMDSLNKEEWREIQGQSGEIGYAFIDVSHVEESELSKDCPQQNNRIEDIDLSNEEIPAGQALLGLGTGVLNIEQVILLLNTLPLDITYVDSNDRVKYFSRPENRTFPRSPAIIGRKVQNCHPPESVHIVEKILEAFRDGQKDKAEFWINYQGGFILISYFAVRNSEGKYLGTLEVSQDISHIKTLEGEKRLLDWTAEE